MTELKCPFCGQELDTENYYIHCHNRHCDKTVYMEGNEELWQALIDANNKLDIALQAFRTLSQITSRLDESYYIDDIIKELTKGK